MTEQNAQNRPNQVANEPLIPEVVPERHIAPEFPTPPHAPVDTGVPVFEDEIGIGKNSSQTVPVGAKPGARPQRPPKSKSTPTQKERYALITAVSALRALVITFAASVSVATIFMWWTSPDFLPAQARRDLAPVQATARQVVMQPTALPTPIWFNRIGILAGHSGWTARDGGRKEQLDSGAVCPDGFFERAVTENVADRLSALLRGRGFTVDVLEEFDPRLRNYRAAAFISLHADSCENFGYGGFKSQFPMARTTVRELDMRLNDCVRQNYAAVTGLEFTPGSITDAMRFYHAFNGVEPDIAPTTPGIILELGFLSYDRALLQNQPERLALGIYNGLMCFLQPPVAETVAPAASPSPGESPVPIPTSQP